MALDTKAQREPKESTRALVKIFLTYLLQNRRFRCFSFAFQRFDVCVSARLRFVRLRFSAFQVLVLVFAFYNASLRFGSVLVHPQATCQSAGYHTAAAFSSTTAHHLPVLMSFVVLQSHSSSFAVAVSVSMCFSFSVLVSMRFSFAVLEPQFHRFSFGCVLCFAIIN